MKIIKLVIFGLLLSGVYSCSVYSSFGDKTTNINSACDDCNTNNKYYRGFGEIEVLPDGSGARSDALSEAKDISRQEIIKEIELEGQVVVKRMNERDPSGRTTSAYKQALHIQAFNQVQNTELKCNESKLVKKTRKGKEMLVVSVCIEMSKKDFNDDLYKENYEMFSSSGIDSETYKIWLSSTVKKKK
tara:strand:- start:159 stop:722 length:564 start_codon:yes stop_codon:yes gene_type:complete